jgi:hypothetical protein
MSSRRWFGDLAPAIRLALPVLALAVAAQHVSAYNGPAAGLHQSEQSAVADRFTLFARS